MSQRIVIEGTPGAYTVRVEAGNSSGSVKASAFAPSIAEAASWAEDFLALNAEGPTITRTSDLAKETA